MNPDKRIIIDDLTARVNASPFLIVVDYTSITVPEFTNLRSALAACGAQCHVAKNNFMRTALTDAGLPDIGEHLVGQTAFVTGASDVAGAAKAINTFAKASKKAEYKVAILDGAILSADEIRAIGELPPRDQLLAKLLGTINAAGSALARVIQAYVDKENGGSEEPALDRTVRLHSSQMCENWTRLSYRFLVGTPAGELKCQVGSWRDSKPN